MGSFTRDGRGIESARARGEVNRVTPFTDAPSDVLLALVPDPRAARQARRALVEAHVPEDLEHTVALLVTELIANSLRHAGLQDDDRIVLAARFVSNLVRVEVYDPGPGFDPEARHDVRGYGLRMVDKLASRWGVETGDDGTRVWFEIDRRRRRFDRERD
jgi:anti-sigma regulatory factor (Ser/Thr protein kinase)